MASSQMGSAAPPLETVGRNDLDRTLIAAIAARSEAAFNEIYLYYHVRIARFAQRVIRCPELTAEITNDTLWAVWRCARSFKGRSKVSTWIMGIAYHISLKTLRKQRRRKTQVELTQEFIESGYEPLCDDEVREWVGAALVQLPDEQRTAIELFYRSGYSCEEIARIVDCPPNTAKARLHHGRRKMRGLLAEPSRQATPVST